MEVGAVYRPGRRVFLGALPFLIMAAVALADALTGPATDLIPLLSLGPALAPAFYGLRATALTGLVALSLCTVDPLLEDMVGIRTHTLAFVTVAGVTAAAIIAAAARRRRERELADVRTIAEVAQRVVLRPLPAADGPVSFAVRYLSASAQAQIGGDLYEVTPGADGTRVIVGDVTGKGLAAVQTAAVVLGAFRAAAAEGDGLAAIAARVEVSLRRHAAEEEFATAVLAHVSPDGAKVSLLNCGHPPPLLLAAGQPARPVDPPSPSLPLGLASLADLPHDVTAVALAPGHSLLFYTDGISEARDRRGAPYPLARNCGAMDWQDPGAALDELRGSVLRHVRQSLDDDAALLLLTRPARMRPAQAAESPLCSCSGRSGLSRCRPCPERGRDDFQAAPAPAVRR